MQIVHMLLIAVLTLCGWQQGCAAITHHYNCAKLAVAAITASAAAAVVAAATTATAAAAERLAVLLRTCYAFTYCACAASQLELCELLNRSNHEWHSTSTFKRPH
eukprot:1643-Heterococcus_DN1.PRE.1